MLDGKGTRKKMKLLPRLPFSVVSGLLAAVALAAAQTPLADKKALTLDTARKIAEAAEKTALANKWNVVISIVDDGGNLLFLERMDDAALGSIQISQQKAHTAAFFKSPTKDFQDGLAKGNMSYLKLDALPFEGGVPIVAGGKVIGAIGVSGGTAAQDGQVAKAGADWLAATLK
jgi:glc operon protein GlcG